MSIVTDATYEDGVLKPAAPLPLPERTQVRLTVEPQLSWVQRTAGLLKWNGDVETLDQFINDPDLEYEQ